MNGREFWVLSDVSNEELEASLSGLLGAGARLDARIVAHLAEVEARRLHLLLGCSSLYDYCRKRIGLSDYEAFVRIAAARAARKFPIVFGMLERRELHLTAICEVREFLTVQNHRELLGEVSGKTKLQIREVLARRFPQADARASLTKLPAVEPLSPGRYRLVLTLSAEQKEKLELARDLLSHANSGGDWAVVVERALDALIDRLEKRRFGQTQPRATSSKSEASTPSVSARRADEQKESEAKVGEAKVGEAKVGELGEAKVGEPKVVEPKVVELVEPKVVEAKVVEPKVVESKGVEPKGVEPKAESWAVALDGAVRSRIAPEVAIGGRRKHIAHAVRREIAARDGGRCTFVGCDGTRCDARAFLQFHHRQAWALGGADTEDNLTLLCYAHNRLVAEQDFGLAHVDQAVRRKAERSTREMVPARMAQPMCTVRKQQEGGKAGRI